MATAAGTNASTLTGVAAKSGFAQRQVSAHQRGQQQTAARLASKLTPQPSTKAPCLPPAEYRGRAASNGAAQRIQTNQSVLGAALSRGRCADAAVDASLSSRVAMMRHGGCGELRNAAETDCGMDRRQFARLAARTHECTSIDSRLQRSSNLDANTTPATSRCSRYRVTMPSI